VINYPLHTFNLNSINRYLLLLNAKYVEAVENALKYFNNVTYSVIYIELTTDTCSSAYPWEWQSSSNPV